VRDREGPPVGGKGKGAHHFGLVGDHTQRPAGLGVPEAQDLVGAARDQHLAWGVECNRVDVTDVAQPHRPQAKEGAGGQRVAVRVAALP
jgi:hypothetical protein